MRTNRGRRLYAFFAVAMAVFLGLMIFTGIVCDGFAEPNQAPTISQVQISPEGGALGGVKTATADLPAQVAEAEAATAAALRKFETANNRLADFLKEHFTELAKVVSELAEADSAQAAAPIAAQAPAERMVPNPAWEAANRQLLDLRRRLTDLLANLTESHPLARQMQITITDLESQLKKIPVELKAPPIESPVAFVPQPEALKAAKTRAEAAGRWRRTEEEYQQLSQDCFSAEQAFKLALQHEQAERRLAEQKASTPAPTAIVLASTGGANSAVAIFLCGTIAIAAGVLVARKARTAEATFHSAAEVRQSLGTAVLGVIPRAPQRVPRERPRQESKWVGRAVQVAEVALAAVVLLLAISSITDSHFFLDLVNDPLAACSKKFWC